MINHPARALLDHLDRQVTAAAAFTALVDAVRAVLDLADQLDRDAETTPLAHLTDNCRDSAARIRAAVATALTPETPHDH